MSDTDSPEFWESIYRDGDTGWDLGGAAPPFIQLLEVRAFPPGKMIVLGAGKGHDARLFARHGYEVTAVDFAEDAVREIERRARPEERITALQADIFDLPDELAGHFDYVLEYVFYCAIDPSLREEYAAVVQRVLKPGGVFVGLIFPLGDHTGGPPFAVSSDELESDLIDRGFTRLVRRFPEESVRARAGREELLIMRKRSPQES